MDYLSIAEASKNGASQHVEYRFSVQKREFLEPNGWATIGQYQKTHRNQPMQGLKAVGILVFLKSAEDRRYINARENRLNKAH